MLSNEVHDKILLSLKLQISIISSINKLFRCVRDPLNFTTSFKKKNWTCYKTKNK